MMPRNGAADNPFASDHGGFALPLRELTRALMELVLPARCAACNEVGAHGFCPPCWQSVTPLGDPCPRCGLPREGRRCPACLQSSLRYASAHAPFLYGGQLEVAICRFKYHGAAFLARPLGALLRASATALRERGLIDRVIPVPLHPRRLRERGYNQAALLAREALRDADWPISHGLLQRIRDTRNQAGLEADARLSNVAGAFAVRRPERVKGQRILLVDDVMTTGSTALACTEALHAAGAREVRVLTLARVVP